MFTFTFLYYSNFIILCQLIIIDIGWKWLSILLTIFVGANTEGIYGVS